MARYYGCPWWYYRVPGRAPEHWDKLIELPFSGTSGGYAADEGHVRFLLRRKLGVKRLPRGTQVWPRTSGEPGSGPRTEEEKAAEAAEGKN